MLNKKKTKLGTCMNDIINYPYNKTFSILSIKIKGSEYHNS